MFVMPGDNVVEGGYPRYEAEAERVGNGRGNHKRDACATLEEWRAVQAYTGMTEEAGI